MGAEGSIRMVSRVMGIGGQLGRRGVEDTADPEIMAVPH